MVISFAEVNYLSVLIVSVVVVALGMLWYSPLLFGNIWVRLQGKKMEEVSGPSALPFIITPIIALVGTWLIALLLTIPNEITVGNSLLISVLVGLFASAKIGMNQLFEARSFPYYLNTISYHLVSCIIAGVVLGMMK